MIHFSKCIKYQYRDTILNQVSVSVSRYNLEVSYPTLSEYNWQGTVETERGEEWKGKR